MDKFQRNEIILLSHRLSSEPYKVELRLNQCIQFMDNFKIRLNRSINTAWRSTLHPFILPIPFYSSLLQLMQKFYILLLLQICPKSADPGSTKLFLDRQKGNISLDKNLTYAYFSRKIPCFENAIAFRFEFSAKKVSIIRTFTEGSSPLSIHQWVQETRRSNVRAPTIHFATMLLPWCKRDNVWSIWCHSLFGLRSSSCV